ncbi:MAG: helix-turn-helix domain-containing protein [Clostridia bacterium]|nr:helix-turn-helix domain-containing protein [Clostridia bacterium]
MKFQKRLKELRISRNLSQKALGKIIGTTYSAICYWENGVNEPKISYVIALCKYFGVTADYLLGLTD